MWRPCYLFSILTLPLLSTLLLLVTLPALSEQPASAQAAPLPARAKSPMPGDTCTVAQTDNFATTAGAQAAPNGYFVVCDGSTWSLFLGIPTAGDVGVNTAQGGMIAPLIASTAQLQAEHDRLKSEVAALQADREQTLAALKDLEKEVRGLKEYTGSDGNNASSRWNRTTGGIVLLLVIVLLFRGFRLGKRRPPTSCGASFVRRQDESAQIPSSP